MQNRVLYNPKIRIILNAVVEEILDVSRGEVTGARIRDVESNEATVVPCTGFFVAIGHTPNTDLFAGSSSSTTKRLHSNPASAPALHERQQGVRLRRRPGTSPTRSKPSRAAGSGCMAAPRRGAATRAPRVPAPLRVRGRQDGRYNGAAGSSVLETSLTRSWAMMVTPRRNRSARSRTTGDRHVFAEVEPAGEHRKDVRRRGGRDENRHPAAHQEHFVRDHERGKKTDGRQDKPEAGCHGIADRGRRSASGRRCRPPV